MWTAIFATRVSGQSTQLATLLHGDEVSIFYGSTALKEAVGAAADGDVITLSAGQFDAIDIDKALTIRGAGMGIDNLVGYDVPTIINGGFKINSPVVLEGIVATQEINYYSDLTLHKCKVSRISDANSSVAKNVLLTQSYVTYYTISGGQLTALNCVFGTTPHTTGSTYVGDSFSTFHNCIFTTGITSSLFNVTLTNCILYTSVNSGTSIRYPAGLGSGAAVYNCIVTGPNKDSSNGVNKDLISNSTSVHYHDIKQADLFKDGTFYELKDEYKSFITTDGTEIGIYGGNLGFSQVTNTPQITKFNVAPKTSVDGKLSVEIQVAGIE